MGVSSKLFTELKPMHKNPLKPLTKEVSSALLHQPARYDEFIRISPSCTLNDEKPLTATIVEIIASQFISKAEKQKNEFLSAVNASAQNVGAEWPKKLVNKTTIKSLHSTELKLCKNFEKPTDMLRTTIFYHDPRAIFEDFIQEMDQKGYKVWINKEGKPDIDNLYEKAKDSGYKHIAIKFVKKGQKQNNPVVTELQILTGKNALNAKQEEHDLYDIRKVLKSQIKRIEEDKPAYAEQLKKMHDAVLSVARQVYAKAEANDSPLAKIDIRQKLARMGQSQSYQKIYREHQKKSNSAILFSQEELNTINKTMAAIKKYVQETANDCQSTIEKHAEFEKLVNQTIQKYSDQPATTKVSPLIKADSAANQVSPEINRPKSLIVNPIKSLALKTR